MDLHVTPVVRSEALMELRDDWNRLAGDVPFRRWEWLEAWWRHFRRRQDQLQVVCVRDAAGRIVGIAPWYIASTGLGGRVFRFLGSGAATSDYLTVLSMDGLAEPVAAGLADWLETEASLRWDAVDLSGVGSEDTAIRHLVERLAAYGHLVGRLAGPDCWRVPLPASWEEYLRGLSRKRRWRVRQLDRRKFGSGDAVWRKADSRAQLRQGLGILIDLHQRRRRFLGQPGCFADPRFVSFLQEVGERFLASDRLWLQWIELRGRPVAVEFDLVGGDTLYYYQSGIDPDCASERPGWLGTITALKLAIEQGYRAYDFLRGDEPYKAHWRAHAHPTVEIRIAAYGAAARLRNRLWLAHRRMARWFRQHARS